LKNNFIKQELNVAVAFKQQQDIEYYSGLPILLVPLSVSVIYWHYFTTFEVDWTT
jgi:hypothetical protein